MSTIRYKYILQYFSVYEKGSYQLEISNEVRGREGGKKKDGIGLGKKKKTVYLEELDQSNPNFSFITISIDRPHVVPIVNKSCWTSQILMTVSSPSFSPSTIDNG